MANQTKSVYPPETHPLTIRGAESLAAFHAAPYLVLSLYLDTEARTQEPPEIRSHAHALLHEAKQELEQRRAELAHDVREAARGDLEMCRAFLDAFVPRGACRGLAIFSCAGQGFWQTYALPRPVADRYTWDTEPLVLPAVRLLEDYPRTGVILVDREQGRYFASRLGEVEELRTVEDDVPGQVREGGLQGLQERRIERHIEDHVHRHLKHVAAEAREVFTSWPITRLLVGGNAELFEDLRRCLVADLRDRWVKEIEIEADAPLEKVHEAVLAAEDELEREHQEALLRQLYDAWRSGGNGVVGIDETLRALYLGAVQTLLVDADLRRPCRRCENCGALSEAGDRCVMCGSEAMRACANLADEAIEDALAHSGGAEIVGEHPEFHRDGGMGGLLRFRPARGIVAKNVRFRQSGEEQDT